MENNTEDPKQELKFTIKNNQEPFGRRCQICHQSDQYDPATDDCSRCQPVFNKAKVMQLDRVNTSEAKRPKFYLMKESPPADDNIKVWKFRIAILVVTLFSGILLGISLFHKERPVTLEPLATAPPSLIPRPPVVVATPSPIPTPIPIPEKVAELQPEMVLEAHSQVNVLRYSYDHRYLAGGTQDGTIYLWDAKTGRALRQFAVRNTVHGLAFSHDGRSLAVAADDKEVNVFNLNTGVATQFIGHNYQVLGVSFSPTDRFLVSASVDKTVRLWNLSDGREERKLEEDGKIITGISGGVAYSSDGRYVVSSDSYRFAYVWNISTGERLFKFEYEQGVKNVDISPNGQMGMSICPTTVQIWNIQTGQVICHFVSPFSLSAAAAFSPDSRMVAASGPDGSLHIWEIQSQTDLKKINQNVNTIRGVAFSPDGHYLAASDDKFVKIWKTDYSR